MFCKYDFKEQLLINVNDLIKESCMNKALHAPACYSYIMSATDRNIAKPTVFIHYICCF